MRWTAVEFNFCSLLSGIILFSGASGMIDAGRLTDDTVDPSSTASWFSINSFFHSGRLLLTSAPCPQLVYPYYLGEKCLAPKSCCQR